MNSKADVANSRGRGLPPRVIRRPFECTLQPYRATGLGNYEGSSPQNLPANLKEHLAKMSDKSDASVVAEALKMFCVSSEGVSSLVDFIYSFAVESSKNSNFAAALCSHLSGITIGETSFKTVLLQKFHQDCQSWTTEYKNLDRFLSKINFLCEMYSFMRAQGAKAECFIPSMIHYFSVLLSSGSEKEIDLFVKHVPRFSRDIRCYNPLAYNKLLMDIRRGILAQTSTMASRGSLLQIFEHLVAESFLESKQHMIEP